MEVKKKLVKMNEKKIKIKVNQHVDEYEQKKNEIYI